MRFPPPKRILPALRYRKFRPLKWKLAMQRRVQESSDAQFFRGLGWKGTPEEFVQFTREHVPLRFHFHARNRKDFFLNLLSNSQPYDRILADAEHVLENRFQTLGSGFVDLGWPIPWHRDFKSGKEWPMLPPGQLDLLDLQNPSDVKVPWELSRFHQVWWLGKAFWLTGNNVYAEKFGELVDDWIARNPVGTGVNWAVSMEVAFRACNWIAGYYFFSESPVLQRPFWIRLFRSLLSHGLWIEHHLEYSRVNGNHFLSNVVGLLFLGIFFKDLECGKRWLNWSVDRLQKEMDEQVYDDGVNHEKSTPYHRLVLELFYSAAILCRRNKVPLSKRFTGKLEAMFDYVLAYTRPDGTIPLVGDADDGRLFRLTVDQDINDHRHALLIGGLLFERPDLVSAAGRFDQEGLWYFGGEGFELYQRLQGTAIAQESRAFPLGGFYILRTPEAHLFFDAGDIGMRGRGGHGHLDTLSFELWAHGAPLIVDSGTYAYTFDLKARKEFQSIRAHNTIMIDGVEPAKFDSPWQLRVDETRPSVLSWAPDPNPSVEAEYHYGSLLHRRKILLTLDPFQLELTDQLHGTGVHQIDFFLHFHPDVDVSVEDGRTIKARTTASEYTIQSSENGFILEESFFSPSYGIRVPNATVRLSVRAELPKVLTSRIHVSGTEK